MRNSRTHWMILSLYIYISISIFSARLSSNISANKKRRDRCEADKTLRTSRAVPHPVINRALCRLTSEVGRDLVHAFDTVWPSGTTMGTGLTIVSFVRLWIRSTVDAHKLTEPYGIPGRFPTPILDGPCATALRRSTRSIPHGMAVSDQDAHRSDHTLSLVFGSTALGKAAITTMAGADSTLRTSRAVPHPLTSRDLCRLTPEVDMAVSDRDGCRSGLAWPLSSQHSAKFPMRNDPSSSVLQ